MKTGKKAPGNERNYNGPLKTPRKNSRIQDLLLGNLKISPPDRQKKDVLKEDIKDLLR